MTKEEKDKQFGILNSSVVYSMSLGNKELFHSNTWKWLMTQNNEFSRVFFPDIDSCNIEKICREDKNRDIVIHMKRGDDYVIENKIKSFPDETQLIEYGKLDNFSCGVITGIQKPSFKLPKGWKFVRYQDIAKEICTRSWLLKAQHSTMIIDDYCSGINAFSSLLLADLEENKDKFVLYPNDYEKLKEVHLLDVYKKLKADDFLMYCTINNLKVELSSKAKDLHFEFHVGKPSFHNGNPTLNFLLVKYLEDKDVHLENDPQSINLGIQIQGNDFRLFCWKRNTNAQNCFDTFSKNGWLDKTYPEKVLKNDDNRKIFGLHTKMIRNYSGYGKEWIYQYYTIHENGLQSYDVLSERIKMELTRALEIIKEYNL